MHLSLSLNLLPCLSLLPITPRHPAGHPLGVLLCVCIARPCRPVPGTSYCSGQNVSPPKTSSLCSKAMFIFFFRSRLPVWMENKYLFAILLSMLLVSGPEAESLDHVMIPFDFLGPVFQFLHVLPSTCFFGSFDDNFLLLVSAKCVLLFIMPYGFFHFLVISVSP